MRKKPFHAKACVPSHIKNFLSVYGVLPNRKEVISPDKYLKIICYYSLLFQLFYKIYYLNRKIHGLFRKLIVCHNITVL